MRLIYHNLTYMTTFKKFAISLGLYRSSRFLYRHLINREQLHGLRHDTAFYSKIVDAGSLCFDVGANIGEKAEALLYAGATVVAFEPQPDCMSELKARCGHRPQFTARQAAVGSQVGETTM